LLFSGEFYDSTAAQYYLRARWYSPATGRFNRTDPFAGNNRDPQSLHKYLYAHNNPVNGIDPSGQFSIMNVSVTMVIAIVLISSPNIANAPGPGDPTSPDCSGDMILDLGFALVTVGVLHLVGRYIIRPVFGYIGRKVGRNFIPRGFKNAGQFSNSCQKIRIAGGADDAVVGIRGSSVTGSSYTTGRPFGPQSDLDFFIVSDKVFNKAVSAGAKPNAQGLLKVSETLKVPALANIERQLTSELGKKASIRIFSEGGFKTAVQGTKYFIP
jgi:RHS repeat-associated protein